VAVPEEEVDPTLAVVKVVPDKVAVVVAVTMLPSKTLSELPFCIQMVAVA